MESQHLQVSADLPPDSSSSSVRITPSEILRKINQLKGEISDMPLVAASGDDSLLPLKKNLEVLSGLLETYLDAWKADFETRMIKNISGAWTDLRPVLYETQRKRISSFWDAYATAVDTINAIPDLTHEQKEKCTKVARSVIEELTRKADADSIVALDEFNELIKKIVRQLGTSEMSFEEGTSMETTPDEIYRKIDQLKREFNEIPPKLLGWIIDPQGKEHPGEMAKAMKEATVARQALINGVFDTIQAYVESHKRQLLAHSPQELEFVIETFAQMRNNLDKVSESMVQSLFETYGDTAQMIAKIPGFTVEQKKQRISAAYERTIKESIDGYRNFYSMVDKITQQFRKVVGEIEKKY